MNTTYKIPTKINNILIDIFPNKEQYIAAVRVIDRLYRCTLHYKDNDIIRMSTVFVEHVVSRKVATAIIHKLLDKKIIQITAKHHCATHTSTGYRLNPSFFLDENRKVTVATVHILDNVSEIKVSKIQAKSDTYFHPFNDIKQLCGDEDKQTTRLVERLQLAKFNIERVKQYIAKWFPNDDIDTITQSYTLSGDGTISMKQRQLIYTYSLLIGDISIQVVKGKKGGRLHHNFCHISKDIWEMLQPANLDHVVCSIDLNAAQPTCLHKILPFPQQVAVHIQNGTFYEFIQSHMYPKSTRQQVKKLVFSKMFNGSKVFWEKFSNISQQCAQYKYQFDQLRQVLKQKDIKLAAVLQQAQSGIFNRLYRQCRNTIIRYDQLVIIGPLQQVMKTEQYIRRQFQQYFQMPVSCHVKYIQGGE